MWEEEFLPLNEQMQVQLHSLHVSSSNHNNIKFLIPGSITTQICKMVNSSTIFTRQTELRDLYFKLIYFLSKSLGNKKSKF